MSDPPPKLPTLMMRRPANEYVLEEGAEIFEPVKYRLVKRLGKGGMGEIWEGEAAHPSGHRHAVAIKVVTAFPDEAVAQALLMETHKLANLEHDNIVRFRGGGMIRGRPFVVIDKIEGPNLEQLAEHHGLTEDNLISISKAEGTVNPNSMIKIPEEILGFILFMQTRALAYCYNRFKIINRDITPENTMLDRNNGFVKVIDFGVAEDEYILAHTAEISGKIHYIAPEVFARQPANRQTDIFSLGLTAYRMLSGIRPYTTLDPEETIQQVVGNLFANFPLGTQDGELITNLEHIVKGVDPELAEIICRMIAYRPDERYQSMDAVHNSTKRHLYKEGVGPTVDTLAAYLNIVDRWQKKLAENPGRSTPVALSEIRFSKEDSRHFPFYKHPEEHLLVPHQLTEKANQALAQNVNPALCNQFPK